MAGYLRSNSQTGQTSSGVSTNAGHDSFAISGYTRAVRQGITRVASCPVATSEKAKAVAAARAARKTRVETAKTIKSQQEQIEALQSTVAEIIDVLNNGSITNYPSNSDPRGRSTQISKTGLSQFK